jgi:hypothetical protein
VDRRDFLRLTGDAAILSFGFTAMMTGTPAADAIDPESARPVGGCSNLSAGQTAWHSLELAAGTYGRSASPRTI